MKSLLEIRNEYFASKLDSYNANIFLKVILELVDQNAKAGKAETTLPTDTDTWRKTTLLRLIEMGFKVVMVYKYIAHNGLLSNPVFTSGRDILRQELWGKPLEDGESVTLIINIL